MIPDIVNLFPSPSEDKDEKITPLLRHPAFRLDHLVSNGRPSPEGFWYDQPEDEWVALLRGKATLDFRGAGARTLKAGDALLIPARLKHRVAAVSGDAVWLALHFGERAGHAGL